MQNIVGRLLFMKNFQQKYYIVYKLLNHDNLNCEQQNITDDFDNVKKVLRHLQFSLQTISNVILTLCFMPRKASRFLTK